MNNPNLPSKRESWEEQRFLELAASIADVMSGQIPENQAGEPFCQFPWQGALIDAPELEVRAVYSSLVDDRTPNIVDEGVVINEKGPEADTIELTYRRKSDIIGGLTGGGWLEQTLLSQYGLNEKTPYINDEAAILLRRAHSTILQIFGDSGEESNT